MPAWLADLLIVVLAPIGALVGSYWGSVVIGRNQLTYERRVGTAETILELLYELGSEFSLWTDVRGVAGRPVDKLTEGELILGKLRRLKSYRQTRAVWVDSWIDPEVLDTLDSTMDQLGRWHMEFFNALPKNPYGMVPEYSSFEDIRQDFVRWLNEDWLQALEKIEHGLIDVLTPQRGSRR